MTPSHEIDDDLDGPEPVHISEPLATVFDDLARRLPVDVTAPYREPKE